MMNATIDIGLIDYIIVSGLLFIIGACGLMINKKSLISYNKRSNQPKTLFQMRKKNLKLDKKKSKSMIPLSLALMNKMKLLKIMILRSKL